MKVSIDEGNWEIETTKGTITAEQLCEVGWYLADDNNEEFAKAINNELGYSDVLAINSLQVPSHFQNQGIGSKLLKQIIKKAKAYGLEAIILNASPMGEGLDYKSLVNFYKKHGFKTYKAFHEHENQTMILKLTNKRGSK